MSEKEKHIDKERHFSALQMTDPVLLYTQSKNLTPEEYPVILSSIQNPEFEKEIIDQLDEPPSPTSQEPGDSSINLTDSEDLLTEELLSGEMIEETISQKKKKKKKKKARSKLKLLLEDDEPASAFIQWMNGLEKPGLIKSGIQKPSKSRQKKKSEIEGGTKDGEPQVSTQKEVESPVEKSIEEMTRTTRPKKGRKQKTTGIQLSADVISETLAEVLASQGHTTAAIEMYEKLCLIYPEKKTLFAFKIEKLKKA